MSDGVCVHVCAFAENWHRERLICGGAHVAYLEKIHDNLLGVANVPTMAGITL